MGEIPPTLEWWNNPRGPLPAGWESNMRWMKAFPFLVVTIFIIGSATIIGKEIYQRNQQTTLDSLHKIPLNNPRGTRP